MSIKFYKIIRFIVSLLFIGVILTAVLMFAYMWFFRMFVDFPCFVSYDQHNHCIVVENDQVTKTRNKQPPPQIEVFLTGHSAMASGGWCTYDQSETNVLEIATEASELKLERTNDILKVSGKTLNTGEKLNKLNILHLNPWIISRVKIENLGLVTDCDPSEQNPRLVVQGSYGTEISFGKGLTILLFLLGIRLLVSRKIKTAPEAQGGEAL